MKAMETMKALKTTTVSKAAKATATETILKIMKDVESHVWQEHNETNERVESLGGH